MIADLFRGGGARASEYLLILLAPLRSIGLSLRLAVRLLPHLLRPWKPLIAAYFALWRAWRMLPRLRMVDFVYRRILHARNPFARAIRSYPSAHIDILAGSESGKSQAMSLAIDTEMLRAQEGAAGFGVVDPHGDLAETILALRDFAPADSFDRIGRWLLTCFGFPVSTHMDLSRQLTVFDVNNPLALPGCNPFDINLAALSRAEPRMFISAVNHSLTTAAYVFSDAREFTGLQESILTYATRVIQQIPDRNAFTLLDFLKSSEPDQDKRFAPYLLQQQDPAMRRFFGSEYGTTNAQARRKEITDRLYALLANPVFSRMFSAPSNSFDLYKIMNAGGIFIANVSKSILAGATPTVTRFFIANALQAAYRRGTMPKEARRPWRLYVDEVQNAKGAKLDELLSEARKYGVSICMAHQYAEQLHTTDPDSDLKASLASNVRIKLVGRGGLEVAEKNARIVGRKAEDMRDIRFRDRLTSEFFMYVSGRMDHGRKITIPLGQLDNRPKMSAKQRERIMAEQRKRHGAGDGGPALSIGTISAERRKAKPVTSFEVS